MAKSGPKPIPIETFDLEQLQKFAAAGLTTEQMAHILGVGPATLDRRIADYPEIKDAINKGRSMAIFNVAASAYQQAISGKNPAMTMFYLKCRARWKETSVTEHTNAEGGDLFTSFTDMVKKVMSDEPEV